MLAITMVTLIKSNKVHNTCKLPVSFCKATPEGSQVTNDSKSKQLVLSRFLSFIVIIHGFMKYAEITRFSLVCYCPTLLAVLACSLNVLYCAGCAIFCLAPFFVLFKRNAMFAGQNTVQLCPRIHFVCT